MSKRKLIIGMMAVLLFLVLVIAILTWLPTLTSTRKYIQPTYTAQQLIDSPLPVPAAIGDVTTIYRRADGNDLCILIINAILWQRSEEDGYDAVNASLALTIDGKKITYSDVPVSQDLMAVGDETGVYGGNIHACYGDPNLENGLHIATIRFEADGTEYTHEWAFEVRD